MYTSTGSVALVCFIVGATFLLSVHARELSSNHKENLAKFKHHAELLGKVGKCTPKIRLEQIMSHPDAQPGATYFPPAAVLHVCDATGGCCYQGPLYQCQPAETEKVEIVFMVKHLDTKSTKFQTFTFENHTRCECGEQTDAPR